VLGKLCFNNKMGSLWAFVRRISLLTFMWMTAIVTEICVKNAIFII
jgi:hypothetical protein